MEKEETERRHARAGKHFSRPSREGGPPWALEKVIRQGDFSSLLRVDRAATCSAFGDGGITKNRNSSKRFSKRALRHFRGRASRVVHSPRDTGKG